MNEEYWGNPGICPECGQEGTYPYKCPWCGTPLEPAIYCAQCGAVTPARRALHKLCEGCENLNRYEFQRFLNSRTDEELDQLNDEWDGEPFERKACWKGYEPIAR